MACGLEVFLQAFRQDIKQDDDVIVVFLHWYLVNNRFVCVVDGKVLQTHIPNNTLLLVITNRKRNTLTVLFFRNREQKSCQMVGTRTNKRMQWIIRVPQKATNSRCRETTVACPLI